MWGHGQSPGQRWLKGEVKLRLASHPTLQPCSVTIGKSLPLSGLLSFPFSNTGGGEGSQTGDWVASEVLPMSALSPVLGGQTTL